MNEERPEAPTKVRSFIMGQLLLEICARFLESCNIRDEVNQEKQEGYMKWRRVKKALRS